MHPGYFPVLFWSLLILVSFWGYGEALRRFINRKEFVDIGWGLTCAWGMAVVIAIGGILMALHLAKAPVLTTLVLFGAAVAVYYIAEKLNLKRTNGKPSNQKSTIKSQKANFPISCVPLFVFYFSNILLFTLALIVFASSIAWPHQIDPNDDLICYLTLPEKILSTGTLIEPLSMRRALTLGGHSFLQSLTMIVGGDRSGHIADIGIGQFILFGICVGSARGNSWRSLIFQFLIAMLILLFPVPRINTMSAYTGSAMLLGLIQTLKLSTPEIQTGGVRCFIPSGLLCAGCAVLRPYFGLSAILIYSGFIWFEWLFSKPSGAVVFRLVIQRCLLPVYIMLPWMIVLYFSNGTLYLPPFIGNVNPDFLNNQALSGILDVLFSVIIQPTVYPLLLAVFVLLVIPKNTISVIAGISIFSVALLVSLKMSAMHPSEIPRYITPLLLPVAVFSLIVLNNVRHIASLCFLLVIFLLSIFSNRKVILAETLERWAGIPAQISSNANLHPDDRDNPGYYHEGVLSLQNRVPRGARILAVIDFPYLLDFSRNDIWCVDVIGAAGPNGGIPFKKGKDALNQYLQSLGIQHVIAMDFNRALLLYNKNYWKNHPRMEWYFQKIFAPPALDFMDSVDSLNDWGVELGSFQNMRVFRLPSIASPPGQ